MGFESTEEKLKIFKRPGQQQHKVVFRQKLLQSHPRSDSGARGCYSIDEKLADDLLDDPISLEDKTFIITGCGPDDTRTFRVVGSGRSNKALFWEILYEDAGFSVRAGRSEMKELLVDGIACEDCFIEASIDTISHVPALDAAGTRTVTKHIQPSLQVQNHRNYFPKQRRCRNNPWLLSARQHH